MTTPVAIDRTIELERKIDRLTEQIVLLTEEALAQRQRRQAMQELQADLTPIATRAIEHSANALDETRIDPADLLLLAVRVANNARLLESMMIQLESMNELVGEVTPILSQAVALAITRMGQFEEQGYFEFAAAGIGVADRIVTNFSKEDVEALGDNVVHMLEIVKDITQPEILAMADRLLTAVRTQARPSGQEPEKPPSLLALAGKMRDPEIRMGLARALNTFKAVAAAERDVPSKTTDRTETETDDTQGGV